MLFPLLDGQQDVGFKLTECRAAQLRILIGPTLLPLNEWTALRARLFLSNTGSLQHFMKELGAKHAFLFLALSTLMRPLRKRPGKASENFNSTTKRKRAHIQLVRFERTGLYRTGRIRTTHRITEKIHVGHDSKSGTSKDLTVNSTIIFHHSKLILDTVSGDGTCYIG